MSDASPTTRERLIMAMSQALRQRGLHGVGLTELLREAKAPKGVLYHHFPGGKTELAAAAIDASLEHLMASLRAQLREHASPAQALRAWLDSARRRLEHSHFDSGCPLAAVALESTSADHLLRNSLHRAFASIRDILSDAFIAAALPSDQARGLAALVVSAYEGALIQARVEGSGQPIDDTSSALMEVIELRLSASK